MQFLTFGSHDRIKINNFHLTAPPLSHQPWMSRCNNTTDFHTTKSPISKQMSTFLCVLSIQIYCKYLWHRHSPTIDRQTGRHVLWAVSESEPGPCLLVLREMRGNISDRWVVGSSVQLAHPARVGGWVLCALRPLHLCLSILHLVVTKPSQQESETNDWSGSSQLWCEAMQAGTRNFNKPI